MRKALMICTGMVVMMAVGTVQADYDVLYEVEVDEDDPCVEFGDASFFVGYDDEGEEIWEDAGLGAGGVEEIDVFYVELDAPCYDITVCVESESCEDCGTLQGLVPQVPAGPLDLCGFTIFVVTDGTRYWVTVTSDADPETAALSEIELCFCEGTTATYPPEGPYVTTRGSPNTAPVIEPEDEDDEVEEDEEQGENEVD